jgi:ABC-type amino acid transport substrate-binding protein
MAMNKIFQLLTTILIAAIVSLTVIHIDRNQATSNTSSSKPSAYDRVVQSKTLRCGYVVSAPHTMKDPNTGQMSGIMYDIAEEMGKRLGIKIVWNEEVTWATYFSGL